MKKADIGAGRKPAPGYDVYTDVYTPKAIFPNKFVMCPMENMPFKDKEFDFARAHHVIEHTIDPDKACSELIRIAKAGVLNFPPPQAEMMFGRYDHNWFVFVDRGRLLFLKKRYKNYEVPREVTRCELDVKFEWKDKFEWQVVE